MDPLSVFVVFSAVAVTAASRGGSGQSQRFGDAGPGDEEFDELQELWVRQTAGPLGSSPAPAAPPRSRLYRPLPYPSAGLEPEVGELTNELHHGRIASGYALGAEAALREWDRATRRGPGEAPGPRGAERRRVISGLQEEISWNISGAVLHDLFFWSLAPESTQPSGRFLAWVASNFGSMDELTSDMVDAAMSIRGPGWAVLAWEPVTSRMIVFPVGGHQDGWVPGSVPLLPIDVWEHAYYGDRGPDRAGYLDGLWKHVDWAAVSSRFEAAAYPSSR